MKRILQILTMIIALGAAVQAIVETATADSTRNEAKGDGGGGEPGV